MTAADVPEVDWEAVEMAEVAEQRQWEDHRDALAAAEARGVERGYRRAVDRLRVLRTVRGPVRWYEVGTAQHHADYLEAVEGDDRA